MSRPQSSVKISRHFSQFGESYGAVSLVIAAHLILVVLLFLPSKAQTQAVELPTITGIMLPAPPAESVQAPSSKAAPKVEKPEPKPIEPKPEPELKPRPDPKPRPEPTPKPVAKPEPRPKPPAAEAKPAPAQIKVTEADNAAEGAPVVPPDATAAHLDNPSPAYPGLSRRLKEHGTVVLEVLILPDGRVGEISIKESSGFERLDKTAIKAVRQWRYEPARQGGKPIAYWYLQPVEFSLN